MSADEFRRWAAEAAEICRGAGMDVPEDDALRSMYDDGMEPEDAAAQSIRKRYERRVPFKRSADIAAGAPKD